MMWINVSILRKLADPVTTPPWQEWKSGPIDWTKINLQNTTKPKNYNSLHYETDLEHLNRISYYIKNGWGDAPIHLILRPNTYPIWDGIHRFCAAILRSDEMILANVEGEKSRISKLYE